MPTAQFTSAYEFSPGAAPPSVEPRQAPPGPLWEGEHEEDFAPVPQVRRDPDPDPDHTGEQALLVPLQRVAPATVALAASAVLLATVLAARALLGGAQPATSDAATARPPAVTPAVAAAPVSASLVAVPGTLGPATLEPRPAAAAKAKRPTPAQTGHR
jgi:hypothetical protein